MGTPQIVLTVGHIQLAVAGLDDGEDLSLITRCTRCKAVITRRVFPEDDLPPPDGAPNHGMRDALAALAHSCALN